MAQVLQNKNLATRFQIMVEIAANQPYIQQKDIAKQIGISSQGVSDYVNKLGKDGWITSDGRSRYRITKEGVNWVLGALRELQEYANSAEKVLTNVTTWAAIADADLQKEQKVSLLMREGLLYATAYNGKGARGVTTSGALKGEDVGISDIEHIVELQMGKVIVLDVPDIQNGGSSNVNLKKIQHELTKVKMVGAVGIEAIIALRRIKFEPDYIYGVIPAAIEAVRSGLSFAVVCTGSESPILLQKLAEANISYKLIDVKTRGVQNRT